MMTSKKLLWGTLILAAIMCACVFFTYAYLGTFTRYLADDFWWGSIAREEGFIGAFTWWYTHFSARFTTIMLETLFSLIGSWTPAALSPLMLIMWFGAMVWAAYPITLSLNMRHPKVATLISVSVVGGSTLALAPSPFQSFHWQAGALIYLLPLLLMSFYLGLLARAYLSGEPPGWMMIISGLLCFLASGTNESVMIMLFGGTGIGAMVVWQVKGRYKRDAFGLLTAGWAGSALAAVLMVLAPGSAERASHFGNAPDLLTRLTTFARPIANFFIYNVLKNFPLLLLILMIGGMGGFILKRDQSFRELSRELIGTFEFGILLIALYFSIGLVINIVLPDRAFLIPQWILVVILMSLGYRVGQLLRLKNPTFIKRPYVFIAALFLLFFTVTGAGSALGEALAKVPLYQEYAALWDRRDEDIRTAVEQGEPSIIIPFLPNVWGVSTIDANAAEGTNIYAARYYGLESIRAVGIPIEESD